MFCLFLSSLIIQYSSCWSRSLITSDSQMVEISLDMQITGDENIAQNEVHF